jgi:hypothetical protein
MTIWLTPVIAIPRQLSSNTFSFYSVPFSRLCVNQTPQLLDDRCLLLSSPALHTDRRRERFSLPYTLVLTAPCGDDFGSILNDEPEKDFVLQGFPLGKKDPEV